MNILHYKPRLIRRTTPVGVIFTVAAVALAMPHVRRGLRCAAVLLAGSILQATDQVQATLAHTKAEMSDFMAEAQTKQCHHDEHWQSLKDTAREHRHRLAVATAAGVLTVSDKATALREEFDSIMEEAKAARDSIRTVDENDQEKSEPVRHRHRNNKE